jgi:hypothetical protein
MTTPADAGFYTAQVRAVSTVAGHACYSSFCPLLHAYILPRGSDAQAPHPLCGCYSGLCSVNGICSPPISRCQLCKSMCAEALGADVLQVRDNTTSCRCLSSIPDQSRPGYYSLSILRGSCYDWRISSTYLSRPVDEEIYGYFCD